MQEKGVIYITFGILAVWVGLLVTFLVVILFVYQKRQHRYLKELEEIKNKYEGELLRSQLEMQELTLQHMSRELHDNIGQFITLAKLHIKTISSDIGPVYSEKMGYAVNLLAQALEDLRNLSKSLSLELIRADGLVKAIESHLSQIKKTGRYDVFFEMNGVYDYMEEEKEIILFRIMQEAINNVITHAQAKSIWVVLHCDSELVLLSVADDGKGFEIDHMTQKGKPGRRIGGINNMKTRAKIIKGNYWIESNLGLGTKVNISVPLKIKDVRAI